MLRFHSPCYFFSDFKQSDFLQSDFVSKDLTDEHCGNPVVAEPMSDTLGSPG